jgi:hypothetical protein
MSSHPRNDQILAVQAAEEIVGEAVAKALRIAGERDLESSLVIQATAHRLRDFAFGAAVTKLPAGEFMKKELRIVRFGQAQP